MPGVFNIVKLFLTARPDLGLICSSKPFGIATERPVGIIAFSFDLILV